MESTSSEMFNPADFLCITIKTESPDSEDEATPPCSDPAMLPPPGSDLAQGSSPQQQHGAVSSEAVTSLSSTSLSFAGLPREHQACKIPSTNDASKPATSEAHVRNSHCVTCNKNFSHPYKLRNHIRVTHNDERRFHCKHCTKTFCVRNGLKYHLEKFHKIPCPKKQVRSRKPNSQEQMIISENVSIVDAHSHVCLFCTKVFKSFSHAEGHVLRMHLRERRHVCVQCDRRFLDLGKLNRHVATVHNKTSLAQCEICCKTFCDKTSLESHVITMHYAEKELVRLVGVGQMLARDAPTVVDKISSRVLVVSRAGQQEGRSLCIDVSNLHACDVCAKVFASQAKLRCHMDMHSSVKQYACPHCTKCFKLKAYLRKHVANLHCGSKVHSCNQCDRKFPSVKRLKSHKTFTHKTHKQIFTCNYCKTVFNQKRKLKTHLRSVQYLLNAECHYKCNLSFKPVTDPSEPPTAVSAVLHKCSECGQEFAKRCSLTQHWVTHPAMKPHLCQLCPKQYRLKSHVTAHVKRVHEQQRCPCERCGKLFSCPQSLRLHTALLHRGKAGSVVCAHCGLSFCSKDKLLCHLQAAHTRAGL